ncbi:hypothetical protein SFR_5304 [Streptomyces sp. FR-008]|nr:hypothetical protein SFR_5304 [Streptomyces sp. FR-008]
MQLGAVVGRSLREDIETHEAHRGRERGRYAGQ